MDPSNFEFAFWLIIAVAAGTAFAAGVLVSAFV